MHEDGGTQYPKEQQDGANKSIGGKGEQMYFRTGCLLVL